MGLPIETVLQHAAGMNDADALCMILANRMDYGNEQGGMVSGKQFPILASDIEAWRQWRDARAAQRSEDGPSSELTLHQFQASFQEHPGEAYICFSDYVWKVRCNAGVLVKPDGETGFPNLQGLLSILAGAGIRGLQIEWDGLPPWTWEHAASPAG